MCVDHCSTKDHNFTRVKTLNVDIISLHMVNRSTQNVNREKKIKSDLV